jgi:AraC-like DNA-binding protein
LRPVTLKDKDMWVVFARQSYSARIRGERQAMPLSLIYQAHPIEQLDRHKIVLEVVKYFSDHYPESFTIPSMSKDLGISLIHVETAFDNYKGKTACRALLEYRLNRLCDHMAKDPSNEIHRQIQECGLSAFEETNLEFDDQFGIDLVEFHKQCFLAAALRMHCEYRMNEEVREELFDDQSKSDLKATRFHRARH